MDPIEFDESNTVYAKDQPQYNPLPCHRTKDGIVTVCWKLSWRERWDVLTKGVLWQTLLTFNSALHPQSLGTEKPTIPTDKACGNADLKSYRIRIAGLDPAKVLLALYNGAGPQEDKWTLDDANDFLSDATGMNDSHSWIGEINGRVVNVHLGREEFNPRIYDSVHGKHAGLHALMPLLPLDALDRLGLGFLAD